MTWGAGVPMASWGFKYSAPLRNRVAALKVFSCYSKEQRVNTPPTPLELKFTEMIHYCYVIRNLCISGNAVHSPFQNSDAYALASHFLCLLVVVREYQTEVIVVPALLVGFFVILLTVILWLHCRGLRTKKREGSSASEQQGNHHSFQRKACWFQWS